MINFRNLNTDLETYMRTLGLRSRSRG